MKKKDILKYIDDNYQGDMDAFYKDYPDMESFKNGGSINKKNSRTEKKTYTDDEGIWHKDVKKYDKEGNVKRHVHKEKVNHTGTAGFAFGDYHSNDDYPGMYASKTVETPRISKTKISSTYTTPTEDEFNYGVNRDKFSYLVDDKYNKKTGAYKHYYSEVDDSRKLVDAPAGAPYPYILKGTKDISSYTDKVRKDGSGYWKHETDNQDYTGQEENTFKKGGYLPMYQMGGTTNSYMDYQDPTATSNLTGGTDFYADTAGQEFDTSIGGEETADAIGAAAGSNPWSGAIYGAATAIQGVAKSGIEYEKDIYGNETNVPVANTSNTNLATITRAPWEAASKEISEGNYGRAAVAGLVPVAGQVIAKQQIEEEQQEFAEGQELAKQEEVKFQENKAAFFSEKERQEKLGQQQLAESPYTTSFAEYGGYVNPVAKVESPEYVGNRKVYGQTHKGPNQGVDVGYASNGLPMAGHGGTLGTPIGNNEGIDNNFVWSDSVFLDEDEYKEFLT